MKDTNGNTIDFDSWLSSVGPKPKPASAAPVAATPKQMVETDFGEMIPAQAPIDPTPFELDKGKQLVALDAEYDRLRKGYDAKMPEWNKQRDAGRPMFGGIHGAPVYDMVNTPKEQKDWESALTELRIARSKLHSYTEDELEQDRKSGMQKSRGRQFWEGFTNQDFVDVATLGWDETGRKLRQAAAIEKLNRGEKLTPGEEALVSAFRAGQAADQYLASKGGNTSWAGVGESVSASIPFMAQVAATGGTGGFVKLGSKALQKGVTGALKRGALKTAEMAANSAIQAPLTSSPYTNYAERTLNQYDVDLNDKGQLTATLARPTSGIQRGTQGFATGVSELFSERFGNVLPTGQAVGNLIKRIAPKALGKSFGGILAKGVDALDNPTVQQMNKWLRKVPGYNGTAGEFAEELVNNVIEPVLTGEVERIPENFSSENLWQTAMSVAIMGGMMETARVPAMAMNARHRAQVRKEAQTRLNSIENPTVKQTLTEAMAISGNEERAKRLAAIDWNGITTSEAAAALDYVELQTYGKMSGGIAEAMQEQQAVRDRVRRFQSYANKDTGNLERVTDAEGNGYFLAGGSIEDNGADGVVFIKDPQTGEVSQRNVNELKRDRSQTYDEYERLFHLDMAARAQAKAAAEELQAIREEAQAAGIDPTPAIATFKGIDLDNLAGQTVSLADGTQVYVNQVLSENGRIQIDALPLDQAGEIAVDNDGNEVHMDLDVSQIATQAPSDTPAEGVQTGQTVTLRDGSQYTAIVDRNDQGGVQILGVNVNDASAAGEERIPLNRADIVAIDGVLTGQQENVSAQSPAFEKETPTPLDRTTDVGENRNDLQNDTAPLQSDGTAIEELNSLHPKDANSAPNNQIGRSLTEDEATAIIAEMRQRAMPATELEMTRENWVSEFGEEGLVDTPVGQVKMGANQLAKMFLKGRDAQLGMIKPTLSEPDAIIEVDSETSDGIPERPSSLLFVKTFTDKSGEKHTYFTSVTVQRDGMEVAISNHIEGEKRVRKFFEKGKLLYRIYGGAQTEQNRVSTSGATSPTIPGSSLNKGTNSSPKAQESQDIPLKQDGSPDYAAMEPAAVFEAIATEFDEDVAREEIANQVKIYETKIAKLRKNPSEDIGKRLANRKAIADLQNRINGLRETIGLADESDVESAVETTDTPKATLRQQSRDLGDYLSLEDKILRDIAEGQKFRWTDNGPQRGLATELGFADSPRERKARFNILANDGITVDQYAERLEHDMDNGVIPSNWDTDIRSGILDVLSRVRSNREAFDAAVALRETDPRTSMTEDDARQQAEYDDARRAETAVATIEDYSDVPFMRSEVTETEPTPDFSTEHRQEVEEIVQELSRASGVKMIVFSDVSELPQDLQTKLNGTTSGIQGIAYGKMAYINASEITNPYEVERVYHHEVAGHRNVEASGLSYDERTALFEAIVDDIGVEHMREQNITELNGEIALYESGKLSKRQLGREYIAYSTERFFSPALYQNTTEPVFSVDLSQPVTDVIIKQLLQSANREYDGKPALTIKNTERRNSRIHPSSQAPDGRQRRGHRFDVQRSNDNLQGDSASSGSGNVTGRSVEAGDTDYQGALPGQDKSGTDRDQQGALPTGGTVTDSPETEDIRYRAAYHGSPNDFERFDHSFIGAGEGAQAFGWGSYVTEVNGIARSYAEQKRGRIRYKNMSVKEIEQLYQEGVPPYSVVLSVIEKMEIGYSFAEARTGLEADWRSALEYDEKEANGEFAVSWKMNLAELASLSGEDFMIVPRNLYTVEIPDDAGGNYLRWADDLLDTERERIISALSKANNDTFDSDYFLDKLEQYEDTQNLTGEGLYKLLSKYGFNGNDQKASEALSKIGFSGIEYPAEYTAGGRADGAKNYVIFNDQDVQITDHVRFRNMAEANAAQLSPEEVNERFNEQLQQQIDSTLPKGHIYQLGIPSAALKAAGVPDLPIELSAERLEEKASTEYASGHPFELSEIENLPQAIANPIAVFDSRKGEHSKVVLTELESKGNNFVAILRVQKKGPGWTEVEINDIRSLYPKDRVGGIMDWINNGLLRWVDKEKAARFLLVQGPNYLGNGANLSGHTVDEVTQQRSNSADVAIPIKGIDVSANIIKNFANPTIIEGEKSAVVETMSEELHVPIRTVTDLAKIASTSPDTLKDKRGASGWYDRTTGEIVVVLPNCRDVAEVQKTILHEAVGHYGIPELLGRDRADALYRQVFEAVKDTPRGKELFSQHQSETVAGDEYLAEMAEGNVTPGVFRRIMAAVRSFFRDVLGIDLKLTDADMRYVLWRSRHNLQNAKTVREAMQTIGDDLRMRKQTDYDSARERKAAQLEKLRQAEPLVFTGDEYKGKYELSSKAAGQYIIDHLRGTYTNTDTRENPLAELI